MVGGGVTGDDDHRRGATTIKASEEFESVMVRSLTDRQHCECLASRQPLKGAFRVVRGLPDVPHLLEQILKGGGIDRVVREAEDTVQGRRCLQR
jgi:hypothetical protein